MHFSAASVQIAPEMRDLYLILPRVLAPYAREYGATSIAEPLRRGPCDMLRSLPRTGRFDL
eukprot:2500353-Rhodomonas_salina.1